ncbi:MAG: HNH endonuclease [Kiritimatiellae bacterium]|nr:HNH endonuclease [Kiritimatiellia bacterium]
MARQPNTTTSGRPFDAATIEAVWKKAEELSGHMAFKKDTCSAIIKRDDYGKTGSFGWEIDHIKPVAKEGTDDLSNLLALHWENNRYKGDDYPAWDCKRKFCPTPIFLPSQMIKRDPAASSRKAEP